MYEEVAGNLQELAEGVAEEPPRGEIVLVVAGAAGCQTGDGPRGTRRPGQELRDQGVDRKQAMSTVAKDWVFEKRGLDAYWRTEDALSEASLPSAHLAQLAGAAIADAAARNSTWDPPPSRTGRHLTLARMIRSPST